jgi:hypothetical protein
VEYIIILLYLFSDLNSDTIFYKFNPTSQIAFDQIITVWSVSLWTKVVK